MEKAFEFVKNLRSSFIELFGYPIIELHSDSCDVKFMTYNIIRCIDLEFECPADEYRLFASEDGSLVIVFTFEY